MCVNLWAVKQEVIQSKFDFGEMTNESNKKNVEIFASAKGKKKSEFERQKK